LTVNAAAAHGRLKGQQEDGNRRTTVSAIHHVITLSDPKTDNHS